jgi:hypothetical protein
MLCNAKFAGVLKRMMCKKKNDHHLIEGIVTVTSVPSPGLE